jgi:hypothetical protein
MKSPPGTQPDLSNGITGTRPKAEIRRELADRFNAAARRSGVTLRGWQVRSLITTTMANNEQPTDRDLIETLMRAPWFPKPRRRHHGVGGPGWRVRS